MSINRRRFAAAGFTFGSLLAAASVAQESNLVGTWDCSMSMQDQEVGMQMNINFEQTYDADGSYERAGRMNISVAALQLDLTIDIDESGAWSLDGMTLTETSSDISFTSASETPSQMESMILQQIQMAAESEPEQTVELESLTATTMEFMDDDGANASCMKV